jgi:hypothetical protein
MAQGCRIGKWSVLRVTQLACAKLSCGSQSRGGFSHTLLGLVLGASKAKPHFARARLVDSCKGRETPTGRACPDLVASTGRANPELFGFPPFDV